MSLRIHRPKQQRNGRILLAFALVIPATGILQISGVNPVSIVVTLLFLGFSVYLVYDACRWIVIITRHGIGISGNPAMPTTWLSWEEIVQVEVEVLAVCITARNRQVYQLAIGRRAALLLSRMVERHLVK